MDDTTQYHDEGGRTLYMRGGNRRNGNNNWLYGVVAFLVVVLAGGGYYFYDRYEQKKKEIAAQEKKQEEILKEKELKKAEEKQEEVQSEQKVEDKQKEVQGQQQAEQLKTTTPPELYGRVNDPDGYANIRRGPSINDPIVKSYNSGDYLYYTPLSGGWSMVYSGNTASTFMGYMSTSRIVEVTPNKGSSDNYHKGYMVDPEDSYVNVRKGPGKNYDIVDKLDIFTEVYYTTTDSNWYKVYDMNKKFLGYVYYNRIQKVK